MDGKRVRNVAAVVLTGAVVAGSAGVPAVALADSQPGGPGYGPQRGGAQDCAGQVAGLGTGVAAPTATLTAQQEQALLHLAEEEKLAHDIYVLAFEKYGLRVFRNIARAETRHEAAMVRLLSRYGMADPTDGSPAGEFQDRDLQRLYDRLSKRVMRSEKAALRVGKKIERVDIRDLKAAKADMPDDVIQVLGNLLSGSRKHLRAFKSWLKR